jgi:hypothetical protein
MNTIKAKTNDAWGAINNLLEEVKIFVKENGGFISTHNSELDTIYAYIVDWVFDNVNEERVIAIRVNNDILEIVTTPYKSDVYPNALTNEDFVEDDWKTMGTGGDSVLTAQTILSIADAITEYV